MSTIDDISMICDAAFSDDCTFYGVLVKQILSVLKERDELMNDREWVLKEAMSGKKLQSGGTFRNVLSRKLNEVVVPIFAKILAAIDHYSNLNIVGHTNPSHRLHQLWLEIFKNHSLCSFSFEQMTGGEHILGVGGKRATLYDEFKCRFPFFWLIKEVMDSLMDHAKAVTSM